MVKLVYDSPAIASLTPTCVVSRLCRELPFETLLQTMGQRHQLFVIAKVKARYRTLCAVHHQWLYGQTALRRCLGTLKIFQVG